MRLIKASLVLFGIVCLIYFFLGRSDGKPNEKVRFDKAPIHQTDFKQILLGKRTPLTEPSSNKECLDFWTRLRELDLQRLNEDIFRGCLILPNQSNCEAPPYSLLSSHRTYLESCSIFMDSTLDKRNEKNLDERAEACFLALVAYRSTIGAWQTKDTPLSEISDIQILGDHLLNEMLSQTRGEKPSLSKIIAVANRVNEVNPHIYSTQKISAIGNLMDVLSKPSKEGWEKARRSLEGLDRFENSDPQLNQLGIWVRTEGFRPEKLHEEAMRMVNDNPSSGLGYFYLAFAEAGMGDRQRVESLLLDAVQTEPNNLTFVRALKNYRAKLPISPPFQFDFDLRVAELTGGK